MRIELTAGPDAGRRIDLAVGAHLLGRAAHCAVCVHDPALEAHHLVVEVGEVGAVKVTQLAGRAPIMVDGRCAEGETLVGRVVEVGHSRLELASDPSSTRVPSPQSLALAECPDPVYALSEAARHLRSLHLERAAGSAVSLGVGTVRLPIDLVDDAVGLPLELQALLARAEWHDGVPVLVDLDARPVIGLVDDHPSRARAGAIAHSIAHQTRSGHQSAAGDQQIGDQNAVVVVLAGPGDPALERCTALLEIGARWRARWTPDLTLPDEFVRLHAAGRAAQLGCSSPSR